MTSTFFGLAPSYRRILHEQVFQLIYYGKGGFTWTDVYTFPVWLRRFYLEQINKILEAEHKEAQKQMRKAKQNRPRTSKPRRR